MPDAVTPALTPEEWSWPNSAFGTSPKMGIFTAVSLDGDQLVLRIHPDEALKREVRANPDGRHALAALCLYQQPFGFSRKDVRLCQAAANGDETLVYDQWERFESLAARIAALLPPEDPAP